MMKMAMMMWRGVVGGSRCGLLRQDGELPREGDHQKT